MTTASPKGIFRNDIFPTRCHVRVPPVEFHASVCTDSGDEHRLSIDMSTEYEIAVSTALRLLTDGVWPFPLTC